MKLLFYLGTFIQPQNFYILLHQIHSQMPQFFLSTKQEILAFYLGPQTQPRVFTSGHAASYTRISRRWKKFRSRILRFFDSFHQLGCSGWGSSTMHWKYQNQHHEENHISIQLIFCSLLNIIDSSTERREVTWTERKTGNPLYICKTQGIKENRSHTPTINS